MIYLIIIWHNSKSIVIKNPIIKLFKKNQTWDYLKKQNKNQILGYLKKKIKHWTIRKNIRNIGLFLKKNIGLSKINKKQNIRLFQKKNIGQFEKVSKYWAIWKNSYLQKIKILGFEKSRNICLFQKLCKHWANEKKLVIWKKSNIVLF